MGMVLVGIVLFRRGGFVVGGGGGEGEGGSRSICTIGNY